jgi:uncharacterized protein YxeA
MADVLLNRRRALWSLAAGGVASSMLLGEPARAADDEIDLAKVPDKVKKAADKAVPGAKWTSASKSVEDGEVTYELEGTDAKQRYVSVEVSAEGKVSEVQTEIHFKEVPEVVRSALKSRMAKANLPKLEASTTYEVRQDGKVVRYDFEMVIGVYISANGKEVEFDDGSNP